MSRAIGSTVPRGATLLELIVSVAIVGVMASVATLMIRRPPPPNPSDPLTIIADTLERVLATGTPLTLQFLVNARPVAVTVNPDGSVIADSALFIDRLTGRAAR